MLDLSVVLARVFLLHQTRLTLDFEFRLLQRQKGHGNLLGSRVGPSQQTSRRVVELPFSRGGRATRKRLRDTPHGKRKTLLGRRFRGHARHLRLDRFFVRDSLGGEEPPLNPFCGGNPHEVRLTWSPSGLETTRHPHVPSLAGLDSSLHPDPALTCWASEFRRSATDLWERLAIISPLSIDC